MCAGVFVWKQDGSKGDVRFLVVRPWETTCEMVRPDDCNDNAEDVELIFVIAFPIASY